MSLLNFPYIPNEKMEYEISSKETSGGWIFKSFRDSRLVITNKRVVSHVKLSKRFSIGGDSEFKREILLKSVRDVSWEYSNTITKMFLFILGLGLSLFGFSLLFMDAFSIGLFMLAIGGIFIYFSFEKRFQIHFNLVTGSAAQELQSGGGGGIGGIFFSLFFGILLSLFSRGDGDSLNSSLSNGGLVHISGKHVTMDEIMPVPNIINSIQITSIETPITEMPAKDL